MSGMYGSCDHELDPSMLSRWGDGVQEINKLHPAHMRQGVWFVG